MTATHLAGRTLADLVLGEDTLHTRHPWVNHMVRRWSRSRYGMQVSRRCIWRTSERPRAGLAATHLVGEHCRRQQRSLNVIASHVSAVRASNRLARSAVRRVLAVATEMLNPSVHRRHGDFRDGRQKLMGFCGPRFAGHAGRLPRLVQARRLVL